MSKILIAVLLAVSLPFVITEPSTIEISEKIYNLIKDLFIGLVRKEETDINNSKCIKILTDKKQYIVENIDEIIKAIGDDNNLFDQFMHNAMNVITIHGLAKNCKFMNFVFFYNQLTQLAEIKTLGENINKNASYIAEIFDPKNNATFFNKIGKFSRDILGLTVK